MLLVLFSAIATHAGELRFENFDVDPGWASEGNGVNGNDFGYQPTSNAGGAPGEAGGTFTRSTFARYHGDTDLGGSLDLDDVIVASGRFDFTEARKPDFGPPFMIGHFSRTGPAKIGIVFTDNSLSQGLFWVPRIVFGDGSEQGSGGALAIEPNVDREWSYVWDPAGGAAGTGKLTVSLSGPGGGTFSIELTAAQRQINGVFDSFGFSGAPAADSDPNQRAALFIDDVYYSAAEGWFFPCGVDADCDDGNPCTVGACIVDLEACHFTPGNEGAVCRAVAGGVRCRGSLRRREPGLPRQRIQRRRNNLPRGGRDL